MSKFEYLFQIHDSVKDITSIKENLDSNYIELKSDVLVILRDIFSETLGIFEDLAKENDYAQDDIEFKKKLSQFQSDLLKYNNRLLKIMSEPDREDAASIIHLITYSQRLKDKLSSFKTLMSHQ